MLPERIIILGNGGSGKSTLSRLMGEKFDYPVTHLDRLFWGAGWKKPIAEEFRAKVMAATNAPRWISEGNYARRTFDLRLPKTELVIWLNTPRFVCLFRALVRALRNKKRQDIPEDCPEKINSTLLVFLKYVWNFERDSRPTIEKLLIQHGGNVRVIQLNNKKQIKEFTDNFPTLFSTDS